MSNNLIDEMTAFDDIDNLEEAIRCLKISHRQTVSMYHGRNIWMGVSYLQLFCILTIWWFK